MGFLSTTTWSAHAASAHSGGASCSPLRKSLLSHFSLHRAAAGPLNASITQQGGCWFAGTQQLLHLEAAQTQIAKNRLAVLFFSFQFARHNNLQVWNGNCCFFANLSWDNWSAPILWVNRHYTDPKFEDSTCELCVLPLKSDICKIAGVASRSSLVHRT